jgi:hypothetical protein
MRSKTTKQSVAPTKPFSLPRENTLKRMPGINTPDQTMGFDHVGHHYQPDLPPVVQEIPGRRAEAESAGSALGLGSEANGYPALITTLDARSTHRSMRTILVGYAPSI